MLNRPATETQITHFQRLWLYMLVALVFAFLIIPCLIVIPMSFSGSKYLEFPPGAGACNGTRLIWDRPSGARPLSCRCAPRC